MRGSAARTPRRIGFKRHQPRRPSPAMTLAVPVLAGVLLACCAAFFLVRRTAEQNAADAETGEAARDISPSRYLAALLINEVPFPGEPRFKNAEDTRAAMQAILWVIECRRAQVPQGYTRHQVAATASTNLIDLITAVNQMQGFYKTAQERHTFDARVGERIAYLELLAKRRNTPTITELLAYARELAEAYAVALALPFEKPFHSLSNLPPETPSVTGSPYGWMTDAPEFHPGGNFVRIPDECGGTLGGNRFYTLRSEPLPVVTRRVAETAVPDDKAE